MKVEIITEGNDAKQAVKEPAGKKRAVNSFNPPRFVKWKRKGSE